MITEAIQRKTYLIFSLASVRMKISPKTKKSTCFFACTVGHLTSSFVPTVGNLPVCFKKNPNARGSVQGGGE